MNKYKIYIVQFFNDFSVVDGYAIFKYWLPYVAEEYRQPYNVSSTETSELKMNNVHLSLILLVIFFYKEVPKNKNK